MGLIFPKKYTFKVEMGSSLTKIVFWVNSYIFQLAKATQSKKGCETLVKTLTLFPLLLMEFRPNSILIGVKLWCLQRD